MSTYCIGDLHGEYDLLIAALDNINFDFSKDKLYLLGDVIDRHTGSIKILNFILDHSNSITLLLGNHEEYFLLGWSKTIEKLYANDMLMEKFQNLLESELYAFKEIESIIDDCVRKKVPFCNIKKVVKWTKKSNKRKSFMDKLSELSEEEYHTFMGLIGNFYGFYSIKPFVKELLNISFSEYLPIKNLLLNCQNNICLDINHKSFYLNHSIPKWNFKSVLLTRDNSYNNTYFVFGHYPVPIIHRQLRCFYGWIDFNYKEILKYTDKNSNFYYNLDMGNNLIAVLRLDDLQEFYAYLPSKTQSKYQPPIQSIKERKNEIENYNVTFYNAPNTNPDKSFVTFKNHCYDFIIQTFLGEHLVIYKRFSDMTQLENYIENWYNGQSLNEIIEKIYEVENYKIQL